MPPSSSVVWLLKRWPLDTDHLEVRLRFGSVAALAVLAVTTVVLSWTAPASACSCGAPRVKYLDELDEMDVVAIGEPEVLARTGAAWGWHRAGVIAFTSAWLVSGDAGTVSETVWTKNRGARRRVSASSVSMPTRSVPARGSTL